MRAWQLNGVYDLQNHKSPLELTDLLIPVPEKDEVLIKIICCGVCHTELDEIEGRTPPPHYPIIVGHQVVGVVEKLGVDVKQLRLGARVGVAWIFSACGVCEFCKTGFENLCPDFKATGRDANGGYAEYMVVKEKFSHPIPESIKDHEAAPLLCAGTVGFRALKLTEIKNGQTLGLAGFGGSNHLVLKLARHLFPDSRILVFARSKEEQSFALSIGATWAGDISERPPVQSHAIIDTTPAWKPITDSLLKLVSGGRLVINAIRKEASDKKELLNISYHDHLWMEKEIKTVANVTRKDVEEFLKLATAIPIKPAIQIYPFDLANQALLDLKHKHVKGAKVLVMG
ncbi:MAG: zinc-dependent alcohol dehydrogenase family protein [Bacteroidetes bacterium]|nr:zinc-dependent alcohol dehydrogenase family protein [Bacteroidota bacterium]